MSEMMDNEVILFNILEELYALNEKKWKERIISLLLNEQQVSYRKIKECFLDLPDLLVYRCIRELVLQGMILTNHEKGMVTYGFTQEGRDLAPILLER